MMVLLVATVIASVCIMVFYIWYLTWPVVEGKVLNVNEGISNISKIRSPSKYRLLTYEFEYEGVKTTSSRQGLIVTSGLALNKMKGDSVRMSVCTGLRSWSCPYRPFQEFFVSLVYMGVIVSPLMILVLLY